MWKTLVLILCFTHSGRGISFPNICDVVNTSSFREELDLSFEPTLCGWPVPRPCLKFSYWIPKYFIEVVNSPKDSMFSGHPVANLQLQSASALPIPFGAEDDDGSYSYHAHVINVPLAPALLSPMPCQGGMQGLGCFAAMSEHLGTNWKTGHADMKQPHYLLWGMSPKACLLKGAAVGITGQWGVTGGGIEGMCSNELLGKLPWYPPTDAPVCTGWGIHFPRTGTVTSSDQTTASLLVASRIKSIGGDVFRSVSSNFNEKWQMMYPQTSSSFKEGQNVAYLRTKMVNETGRLKGRPSKFLYLIWHKVSCTRDMAWLPAAYVWLAGLQAVCKGFSL